MLPKTSEVQQVMMDKYKLYNTTWDKISTNIKREFDSKPVHHKNF